MNAHVLLNLLNELGRRDKMRGLKSNFCAKNVIFCHYLRNVVMDVIAFPKNR